MHGKTLPKLSYRSGTEEQVNEKIALLHDIVSLQADFAGRRPPEKQVAAVARNEVAAVFSQHSTGITQNKGAEVVCWSGNRITSFFPALFVVLQ